MLVYRRKKDEPRATNATLRKQREQKRSALHLPRSKAMSIGTHTATTLKPIEIVCSAIDSDQSEPPRMGPITLASEAALWLSPFATLTSSGGDIAFVQICRTGRVR